MVPGGRPFPVQEGLAQGDNDGLLRGIAAGGDRMRAMGGIGCIFMLAPFSHGMATEAITLANSSLATEGSWD